MTHRELHFSVEGRPAPQGSKVSFVTKTGKIATHEQSKYVGPWREAIHHAALEAADKWDWAPATGPVVVHVRVWIQRPASNQDDGPINQRTGDLDKHLRAVFDALQSAGIICNDSQIMDVKAAKRWVRGDTPGADISVFELAPPYCYLEPVA